MSRTSARIWESVEKAKFSVHTISNGIRRDGMPAADLVLCISKALNVPLEKLLGWNERIGTIKTSERIKDRRLFVKYLPLIKRINELQTESRKVVLKIIEDL